MRDWKNVTIEEEVTMDEEITINEGVTIEEGVKINIWRGHNGQGRKYRAKSH